MAATVSKADLARFGDAAPPAGDIVAIMVESLDAKDALLAIGPRGFFTIPHFNGYPAVLVQIPSLARLDRDELEEMVVEAWLTRAHKRVAKAWLAEQGAGETTEL